MLILRARWVLPIAGAPIENGEVVIEEDRIAEVRPQSRSADGAIDFGEAAILPGLVNAHTHLEYTAMRGFLEDIAFFPWIRALTAAKAHLSREDWELSSELGALESIGAGITTIGDNTDAGVTMRAAIKSGLRARIYQEVFGIDHRDPVEPIVAELKTKVDRLQAEADRSGESERIAVGISPHAPYTVRPELFAALKKYANESRLPMSIHIAESPAESALIERGSGPFGEMLMRRGILWQTPGVSPTRYLFDQGMLGPGTLAVHCAHQSEEDIALLASTGAAIAHCPKSNAKLGAGIAPLDRWLTVEGLPVGLGTDSAVSNNTLDLFEEMRFGLFLQRARAERVEGVTARQMVEIATLGGASALGWAERIGTLAQGMRADVIAVRLDTPHATPAEEPYGALVYSARAEDVCFTMASGRVLYQDGDWKTLEMPLIVRRARELRSRLRKALSAS